MTATCVAAFLLSLKLEMSLADNKVKHKMDQRKDPTPGQDFNILYFTCLPVMVWWIKWYFYPSLNIFPLFVLYRWKGNQLSILILCRSDFRNMVTSRVHMCILIVLTHKLVSIQVYEINVIMLKGIQWTLAYPALLGPGCVRIIEMSR